MLFFFGIKNYLTCIFNEHTKKDEHVFLWEDRYKCGSTIHDDTRALI